MTPHASGRRVDPHRGNVSQNRIDHFVETINAE